MGVTKLRDARRDAFKKHLESVFGGQMWLCGFWVYLPEVFELGCPDEFEAAYEQWLRAFADSAKGKPVA